MKQYILIAALAFSFQLQAQTSKDTTLQRTLILEKEYNPTIDKASKVNTLPEVREPEAPQAKIEYSNYSVPINIKPEPSQVEAAKYFEDLNSSQKRGYVKAGISTFIDVDGDAGYQILNSESDELSVWLSHRSSSGKVKSLQSGEKLELKLNDNTGAFRYSHNFESSKLFADAKYTSAGFNYYGGFIDPLVPLLNHPNQTDKIFDTNLGLASRDTDPVGFLIGMNFSHFEQKESLFSNEKGIKENSLKLNFNIYKDLNEDKLIGVAGVFKTNSYSTPDISIFDLYKNYGTLGLNPYFKMEGDNWKIRLGVINHILFKQSKNFFVTPDVEFSFRPYETGLLYLTAKGEVADNSNKNIFYENRYVFSPTRVLDSYTGLDGTIGFKASFSGVFDIDLYAGYKITQQEHFYYPLMYTYNSSYPYLILIDYETSRQMDASQYVTGSGYDAAYYDTKVFKLGTNLKYQYGKMFNAGLKATYYKWKVDKSGAEAWNKPEFESDFTAGFQFPTTPLHVDLAYHLETGRKFIGGNMKNIHDISLTETYTFNDTFSVFARIDNLLAQKYDIWYGSPAEGFRLMGGLSVKF